MKSGYRALLTASLENSGQVPDARSHPQLSPLRIRNSLLWASVKNNEVTWNGLQLARA